MDSSQPSQENVLVSFEEQQHEDSDTKGKSFVSNSAVEVFLISFFNYYGICVRCLMISET